MATYKIFCDACPLSPLISHDSFGEYPFCLGSFGNSFKSKATAFVLHCLLLKCKVVSLRYSFFKEWPHRRFSPVSTRGENRHCVCVWGGGEGGGYPCCIGSFRKQFEIESNSVLGHCMLLKCKVISLHLQCFFK